MDKYISEYIEMLKSENKRLKFEVEHYRNCLTQVVLELHDKAALNQDIPNGKKLEANDGTAS